MVQKWTKENIINEAKKYATRNEFKKNGKGAYDAAHRYKLFNEFYWFTSGRNKKRKWKTKEIVFEESKKYSSRTEFNKKSHRAYENAKANNWLDEMIWLNRKNVYTDKVDTIYKYYFKYENVIYIGRTTDIKLRDYQHKTVTSDSVYKFAKERSIQIPNIEIIENNLTLTEGRQREKYWVEYYRNNGFNILNKVACGSIGSLAKGKWSKTKCFQESKKYKSRGEFFKKNSNAYQKSLKNGWLDEMIWLTNTHKQKRGYWLNKENVFDEAKKYASKYQFQTQNSSAFIAAYKNGWLDEMTWFNKQKQKPYGYWKNEENIINEAKKYSTLKDFRINAYQAYKNAKESGLINDFTWFTKKNKKQNIKKNPNNKKHPHGYWKNKKNIMKEARKYKTNDEFKKGNLTAFLAAYRYGYIDDMIWLIKRKQHKKGYWNYKHIEEEALKYTTKTEFAKKCNTAYRKALKMGIIDDFFLNNYIEF